jgi:YYY domain-containing protein
MYTKKTMPLPSTDTSSRRQIRPWVYDLLLVYILIAGAYFRFTGLLWGEYQYLHPDERFLVWVGSDIKPVESLGDYFNTEKSTLNPQNTGHGFYVYGTLPMFITRYVVEWVFNTSGFDQMTQAGRALSALADLLTIFLVYLVAERLYDKRVAVLSAAFSAAAVLQIQQSHFFTMDTFINAFSFLAFYFAVRVATQSTANNNQRTTLSAEAGYPEARSQWSAVRNTQNFFRHPLFGLSLGFGLALGMAVASKINAAPMAATLPLALIILLFRQPATGRSRRAIQYLLYLFLAAVISMLTFRIFQPYAFSGPGFLGVTLNPKWVANIRELVAQSSGDVDFPPAMQWARRQIWFSFQNLTTWGLGLPLGILAWAGFIWAGWRLLTGRGGQSTDNSASAQDFLGERQRHALIWLWTAVYFIWQSLALNPTMRYQLPIYPTLVIFAGWFVVALYDQGKKYAANRDQYTEKRRRAAKIYPISAVIIGGVVLLASYAYAYAFTQIYNRPITRVEASRWIYQNIPGPINLLIQTPAGQYNQIISYPYGQLLRPGTPFNNTFQPKVTGKLSQVALPHLLDESGNHEVRTLELTIAFVEDPDNPLASARLSADLTPASDNQGDVISNESLGKGYVLDLDHSIDLDPDRTYQIRLKVLGDPDATQLVGLLSLHFLPLDNSAGEGFDVLVQPPQVSLLPGFAFKTSLDPSVSSLLTQINLATNSLLDSQKLPEMRLSVKTDSIDESQSEQIELEVVADERGLTMLLAQPLSIFAGEKYTLSLELVASTGNIQVSGTAVANEGEWDDGLPLRMDGYDGFGGIYPRELNFNMYWDDNPDKLERFVNILNQTEYIFISSNRQWGTLPRLPERFPLTTIYYRALLGCPPTQEIVECYRVAQPGMFEGKLGFDLVKVFESPPTLGPLRLNDQFAEEAFTVYDHPKVLIFKKRLDYSPLNTQAILGSTDFGTLVRVAPMRAPAHPANLLLPDDSQAVQQQGGTWSELFNTQALFNRFEPLGVLLWYLCVGLLGLVTYPLLRLGLPGLEDGGYPLARVAGMLILSYLVWLAGSFDIPFSRLTISAVMLLILALSLLVGYRQRDLLRQEWQGRRKYFLIVEGLTLAFFLFFLFVRLGNPDLWHPWKGGEKPMDFSYFNAVLKSTTFPPYDPWFAGGYLNYYYYGYVMVGVLVKWLGLVPAFAYNLILPTLFSMIAMGAFSIVWNIAHGLRSKKDEVNTPALKNEKPARYNIQRIPFLAATAGALGVAVLGNLGTLRMISQGWERLAAPGGTLEGANMLTRWVWAVRGLVLNLTGTPLPYGPGDWYWIPSRVIPAPGDVEPITEFPYFTVLYADLHAHLMAIPITLLALACILSIVLSQGRWKSWLGGILGFFFAGLAVGALQPTNTWNFYPYLALGVVGLAYTLGKYYQPPQKMPPELPFLTRIPKREFKLVVVVGAILLFVGLSYALFVPYMQWYALGYDKVHAWEGTHTPVSAYLTHWGLFLFLIVSWMIHESIDWMANTPISALRKLLRYKAVIWVALVILLAIIILLTVPLAANEAGLDGFAKIRVGAPIAWLVLPLAAWAGILILRPGQPDLKRVVLFMIGTGLVMTLAVELVVLTGDIGRMNTVFKFYLQVWTLFAISAAASLGWLLPEMPRWRPNLRWVWQTGLVLLVMGASLYTIMATLAKIKDRISDKTPLTLDGMAYMLYSTYNDNWGQMSLDQDYEAIRWMQENVTGSPVIVEANLRNLYRWGSRFTINTGLPGVVGWEWHEQQQRAINPGSWVSNRIIEIENFYFTIDLEDTVKFLRKYDVQYIILGQQERGMYPGPGLQKFADANGLYWREVFRTGETVIYQVTLP